MVLSRTKIEKYWRLEKSNRKIHQLCNNKIIKTKLKTSPVDYRFKNTTTHKMVVKKGQVFGGDAKSK